MSQTLFAIKGKLGVTDYYVVTMKAGELVNQVRIPKDVPGWDNMNIEERYPRHINENIVKKIIAPYLANNNDRFFGSLLVTMINAEDSAFEPLGDMASKLPLAYRLSAKNAGFLTLSGGEVLVPLDGQHRLRAIKYAIDGKDGDGRDLGCPACPDLAEEDVVVILFQFEPNIAKKIFMKVNRCAKPTTQSENLITDDDDIVAVITREVANKVIGARVVHYTSSSLSNRDREFTTLASLYNCTEHILNSFYGKIDKHGPGENGKKKMYTDCAIQVWETLTEGIRHFQAALADTEETGDDRRRKQRQESLLSKPIAQFCLVQAFMQIKKNCRSDDGKKLKDSDICKALNTIDWDMQNPVWQHILMNGKKILSKGAIPLAVDAIIYFAGFKMQDEEKFMHGFEKKYRGNFLQTEDEQAKIQLPERSAGRIKCLN